MSSSRTPLLATTNGDHQPQQSHTYHSIHSHHHETEEELTSEELAEYERGVISWRRAKSWKFWVRKEWIWGYIGAVILIILVTLMTVFHRRIVDWLMPFSRDLHGLKAGFIIPVALIFVLSFPPLFGNEIIIILVGVVWGLGIGSAIVAAGVILGESATYAMFKYCCRNRAERMTKKDLNYACLSQVITEGGFPVALVVRLSVLPTHFTTAVLAICGLRFYHFIAALILGLPKQILAVYAGSILAQKHASTSSRFISNTVFAITGLITVAALRFIYRRMIRVRKKVLISMRDDLRSKGVAVPSGPAAGSDAGDVDEEAENAI